MKYGFGRAIAKEEALAIIASVQKAGGVHTVFHERDDARRPEVAICNCCWDCCGALGNYNRGAVALHFKSYYLAELADASLCRARCRTCERFCPVAAIARAGDGPVAIDARTCIGCGQCANKCPHGALGLRWEERDVFLPLLRPAAARIDRSRAAGA
jgi:ferredoxin